MVSEPVAEYRKVLFCGQPIYQFRKFVFVFVKTTNWYVVDAVHQFKAKLNCPVFIVQKYELFTVSVHQTPRQFIHPRFRPHNAIIIANPCNTQTTLGIFVIKNTAANVTDFDVVILDKRTKTIISLALSVRFSVTFVGPLAVQVPLAVAIHTESIYITHFDFDLAFTHAMKLPLLLGISASQLAQQSNVCPRCFIRLTHCWH